ncbi:MAG: glycoside hydrolase family 43 protein [Sphaerochaetaceae bacterium]|nr:glycoside hydrolase family 43 protein [Sphaerochaetaceae bacterium]
MYRNPVIPGFAPDPSITYWNGHYYLVTSTFEYFPGVSLWTSDNLVDWTSKGAVLTRTSQLDLSGAASSSGLYAASIRVNANGRFYMVTTNKYTHENFICHTDDIDGPWSEISFIAKDGIDPSLLFLSDGRCFYTSNGSVDGVRGIKGAFINPDTGELLEDFHLLSTGLNGHATEGPHIYEKDGWYYLMFAEGGTGYGHYEAILRSKDIHGPYENLDGNPVILSHVPRKGHPIQATGHADLIQTPNGDWYAVFLGIRVKPRPLLHHLGRETFLAKVSWENGWPMVGDHGFVELENAEGPEQKDSRDYSVCFDRTLEHYPYLKVRVPKEDCYQLDLKAKSLTLMGEEPINTPLGHPTLLAFRQKGLNESMKATLDQTKLEGTAGIASWLSCDYHYRLQVTKSKTENVVSLIRHLHDFEAVTEQISLPIADSVELEIQSDDEFYHFYADGHFVGKASVYGLASEGTMYNTFTGALFAIYAENGKATFQNEIHMESKR